MHVRDDLDVGVATHTGPVRGANEDDFVLFDPEDPTTEVGRSGRLFAVADGMGGVAGGAEASRTAIRALLARFLQSDQSELVERLRDGFEHAAREVYRASRTDVQLADMGTTLTAIAMRPDGTMGLGHVGDSRCLRLRDRKLERITEDHAVDEPRHLLTRCLGAGRETEQIDLAQHDLRAGDVFVLLSDGAWGPLDDAAIVARIRSATSAQRAAEAIVGAALDAGTTDNATALVVHVLRVGGVSVPRDLRLPAGETSLPLGTTVPEATPPVWPWVVLVLGAVIAVVAVSTLL